MRKLSVSPYSSTPNNVILLSYQKGTVNETGTLSKCSLAGNIDHNVSYWPPPNRTILASVDVKNHTKLSENSLEKKTTLQYNIDNKKNEIISEIISKINKLGPARLKIFSKSMSVCERRLISDMVNNREISTSIEQLNIIYEKIITATKSTPNLNRKYKKIKLITIFSRQKMYKSLCNSRLNINMKENGLKPIDTHNLVKILDKLASLHKKNPDAHISLATYLNEHGYSSTISNINISSKKNLLCVCSLEGINFISCKFDWTHFNDTQLKNTKFHGCQFKNSSFKNTSLKNCEFNSCLMRETMFISSHLDNTKFLQCDIISSSFEDAIIKNSEFKNITVPGTHFLETKIFDTIIQDSELQDGLFFGNLSSFKVDKTSENTAISKKAPVAILASPEDRGITIPKAFLKLDEKSKTIPLKIAIQAQRTTKEQVNKEVEAILASIEKAGNSETPIPQQLLKIARDNPLDYPCIGVILSKAKQLAGTVDGIFLPGGEDIPAALYGEQDHEKNAWGGDYRRSILELGLIDYAINRGIPLMSVCRGFQMSNVYFGAHLVQDINGHRGRVQKYQLSNNKTVGLYGEAFKKNIKGISVHHQAVLLETAPNTQLKPAVIYNGVVKASELEQPSAPVILLQFHPEFYSTSKTAVSIKRTIIEKGFSINMSESNEVFWKIFSDGVYAHKHARAVRSQLISTTPIITDSIRL